MSAPGELGRSEHQQRLLQGVAGRASWQWRKDPVGLIRGGLGARNSGTTSEARFCGTGGCRPGVISRKEGLFWLPGPALPTLCLGHILAPLWTLNSSVNHFPDSFQLLWSAVQVLDTAVSKTRGALRRVLSEVPAPLSSLVGSWVGGVSEAMGTQLLSTAPRSPIPSLSAW